MWLVAPVLDSAEGRRNVGKWAVISEDLQQVIDDGAAGLFFHFHQWIRKV